MKEKKNYQIVARKYRPQTFSEVVGQDAIVTTLKNSLKGKRIPHAYLFSGTRGTGKTTLARLMAKALNCTALTEECEPCNECTSCKEITAGHSLNVIEIDGASNRGIDDMRQINETISFVPSSKHYKIYIIDEVHMLTREAFNALLKTLEEPPPNVKFFFATTEPHKVLPTIISRCQRYDLNRISVPTIQGKLREIACDLGIEVEEEALLLIAQSADGALRDAESLFDQMISACPSPISAGAVAKTLGRPPKELFFELDRAVSTTALSFAFECAKSLFDQGRHLNHFLETLLEHYRSLLVCKISPTHGAADESYQRASTLYTQEQCFYIIDLIISTIQQLTRTPFNHLHLEVLLLKIIRSKNVITLATLTNKLRELQGNPSLPPLPPPAQKMFHPPPPQPPPAETPQPPPAETPQPAPAESSQPPPEPPLEEPTPYPPQPTPIENKKSHYDTLVRFTAVELEGSIKQ